MMIVVTFLIKCMKETTSKYLPMLRTVWLFRRPNDIIWLRKYYSFLNEYIDIFTKFCLQKYFATFTLEDAEGLWGAR